MTAEIDAEGGTTSYTYDDVGNMLTLTDPESNVTTWEYDALDRMTTESIDLTTVVGTVTTTTTYDRTHEYDALGQLTSRTDRNGRVRTFTYEHSYDGGRNQRMTSEEWFADASDTTADHSIGWTYETEGYLDAISSYEHDGSSLALYSAITYDYDELGRVTAIGQTDNPHALDVTITQAWDNLSRRTSVETTIGGTVGSSTVYSYDVLGRMTSIEQTDADTSVGADVTDKLIELSYNALGQYETINRYEDLTGTSLVAQTRYDYDTAHRLTGIVHDEDANTTNGNTITNYEWTWDADDRIETFAFGRVGQANETVSYTYDDTNQLTGADYDTLTDENYTYDANGNRTNTGYTTGDHNRLTADGAYTYEYDHEGNRTRKTDASGNYTEYDWDHRNRLIAVREYDSSATLQSEVTYTYDGLDRKIVRQIDENGDLTIDESEAYIYDAAAKRDGVTEVPLDDVLLVFHDDDGDGPNNSSLTTRYLHGPGIDQVLAAEDLKSDGTIDEVYWTLTDRQGTVRSLISHSSGTITLELHRTYDAFGNLTTDVSTPDTIDFRYAYTGREWDAVTELQYNRRRWYDPSVGQWISEDPIGFAAGDVNLTRYVSNSPGWMNDSTGLVETDIEPKKLEGMPWYDGRLPGGTVGTTHVHFFVDKPKVVKKDKCDFRLKFKMTAKVWIELDSGKIRGIPDVTLETAYGHEQRHVRNFSKIVGIVFGLLQKAEGVCYESEEKAQDAGKTIQKQAMEAVVRVVEQDKKHRDVKGITTAPKAGVPYPPIGTMPVNSTPGTPWKPETEDD